MGYGMQLFYGIRQVGGVRANAAMCRAQGLWLRAQGLSFGLGVCLEDGVDSKLGGTRTWKMALAQAMSACGVAQAHTRRLKHPTSPLGFRVSGFGLSIGLCAQAYA
eukprot:2360007-Rhodomonas_salina.1